MCIVKVKPWGKDQGDSVLIEEADYNPAIHQLCGGEDAPRSDEQPIEKPEAGKAASASKAETSVNSEKETPQKAKAKPRRGRPPNQPGG